MGGTHLPGAGAVDRLEPADVHPPRYVHHRIRGRVQPHGDGAARTTMYVFALGTRNYGTVFRTEVAGQLGS